jgi:microcin C transport system substrate-binding protein
MSNTATVERVMKNFAVLVSVLLLAACGQSSPTSGANTAEAPSEPSGETVTPGDTRLVANPPTYNSVPLPDGLVWLTNDSDTVFASPEAKRGGTLRGYMEGFPLTLRLIGPDSNSDDFVHYKRAGFYALRSESALVDLHPNTLNFTPYIATHWAFGADGKTVYYKLNPRARWSDGEPVTADDFLFTRDLYTSEHTVFSYGQNYFTSIIAAVRKHDEHTISVEGFVPKPPNEMLYELSVPPSPRHFHKLDANWVKDYDWRIEPNIGPYQVARLEKGRYIELKRVENWWGDELKYNKNRFNVDTIRLDVIRDVNVAYEYFLRGELDRFLFETNPARWHDKARGEIFDKGYAGRIQYYNDRPRYARGLWLNLDDPLLADKNVRYGLAHALNVDRAISTVFRGDYSRLHSAWQGSYWGYTNTDVKALPFDVGKANEYLDTAGWTQRGPDAIRVKGGQRLAVTISYGTDEHTPWLIVVREEARKAGIELNLQLLDPATWGRQLQEKKHQIILMSLGRNLTPSFWQSHHSDEAHKPNTNNVTNTDIPELDALIEEYDQTTVLEQRVALAHRIEQIIADEQSFIPLYTPTYVRETFWRWMKLPEWHSVRMADDLSGGVFDPVDLGIFWIDEEEKAATLEARASGRAFPPIDIVDTTWRVD